MPCLLNFLNLRSAIAAGLWPRLQEKFCFAASPPRMVVLTALHTMQWRTSTRAGGEFWHNAARLSSLTVTATCIVNRSRPFLSLFCCFHVKVFGAARGHPTKSVKN